MLPVRAEEGVEIALQTHRQGRRLRAAELCQPHLRRHQIRRVGHCAATRSAGWATSVPSTRAGRANRRRSAGKGIAGASVSTNSRSSGNARTSPWNRSARALPAGAPNRCPLNEKCAPSAA